MSQAIHLLLDAIFTRKEKNFLAPREILDDSEWRCKNDALTRSLADMQKERDVARTDATDWRRKYDEQAREAAKWKVASLDCAKAVGGAAPQNPDEPASVVDSVKAEVKEQKYQLEEARRAQREYLPWIGFEVTESAIVKSLMAGSAAAEAGVNEGDKCVQVGSENVSNLNDFRAAMKGVHPGMTVPFTFQREGSVIVKSILVRCISMKEPDHRVGTLKKIGSGSSPRGSPSRDYQ